MKKRKSLLTIMAMTIMLIVTTATAFASAKHAIGVTDEMCESAFWYDKTSIDTNTLLMSKDEINELNEASLVTAGTNMYDLVKMNPMYNAKKIKDSLANSTYNVNKTYFVNTESVDAEEYFGAIRTAISTTGFTETKREVLYAVTTEIADLKSWPTSDYVGYSATDTDDELQESSTCVNEPFVIKQKCINNGELFYWGYTDNCTGWIPAKSLAICNDKEEWLDAWQVDINAEDFLVVTQDKIFLEMSYYDKDISQVEIGLGSILKLVAEEDIPAYVGERGIWNNYVVYLPTRDIDGKYVRKMALISQHYNVNIGFLSLTQKNILDLAFSCLGNRYGWGGMLHAMDCSQYEKCIYRCFGFNLPRNTTWQRAIPGKSIDLTQMSDDEKVEAIKKLPAGTMLYFPGHTFMYIGCVGDELYCINAVGSLVAPTGDIVIYRQNSVTVNPLSVRRGSGKTWLQCAETAVVPVKDKTIIKNVFGCEEGLHSIEVTGTGEKKEATCTTDGKTIGVKCNLCGHIFSKESTIAATGHQFGNEYTVDKQATASWNGSKSRHCIKCDEKTDIQTIYAIKQIECEKTGFTYTGKQIKPEIKIKDIKGNWIASKNYKITYGENTECGKGKIIVSFEGEYLGTMICDFKIVPKKVKLLGLTNTAKGITVKWEKNDKATGYFIYRSMNNGSYVKIKNIAKNEIVSYTDKNATLNGAKYQYKIIAYKADGTKLYKSTESKALTTYRMTRPKAAEVKNTSAGKAVVIWEKSDKATGYKLKYVTGTKEKTLTIRSAKTVNKVISKLSKGSVYKFYIRSYKTVNNKNYYSAWSKATKLKIRK